MSRRERHIRELAAELGIPIILTRRPRSSYAGVPLDGVARASGEVEVWGWDGRSQLGYFVALHELGHHAHRHPQTDDAEYRRRYRDRVVEAEAEAWAWALEHAAEPPGAEVIELIRTSLGSYVRGEGLETAGPVYASVASRVELELAA